MRGAPGTVMELPSSPPMRRARLTLQALDQRDLRHSLKSPREP